MPARQPTIIATSIGFQSEGPDLFNLRPGPSFHLAAELAQAGAHPRVCIVATAVGDDAGRLAAAHNAFSKVGFVSSHLALFPMPNRRDMRAHLLDQDVIWVGEEVRPTCSPCGACTASTSSSGSAGRPAWSSRGCPPVRCAGISEAPRIPSVQTCAP